MILLSILSIGAFTTGITEVSCSTETPRAVSLQDAVDSFYQRKTEVYANTSKQRLNVEARKTLDTLQILYNNSDSSFHKKIDSLLIVSTKLFNKTVR